MGLSSVESQSISILQRNQSVIDLSTALGKNLISKEGFSLAIKKPEVVSRSLDEDKPGSLSIAVVMAGLSYEQISLKLALNHLVSPRFLNESGD